MSAKGNREATFELTALERELKLRQARKDINAFCEYAMRDSITGEPFKQARIHREFQNYIDTYQRVIVLLPRECGKTSQMIARCLFELGRNCNHKIKIVCSTSSIAKKRVSEIRAHLMGNTALKEVFPNLKESTTEEDWSKTSITIQRNLLDKEPSVEAAGVLDSAVGGRSTFMIFDDVVNYRNSILNPAMKPLVISAFDNVWEPFLVPGGKIVYIATPWTEDDLTATLIERGSFMVYKASVDKDFNSPWPERYGPDYYKSKARELSKEAFFRSYLLETLSSEEKYLPLDTLTRYLVEEDPPEGYEFIVAGVDLGMSESSRTETVISTVGVKEKTRYLLDVTRGKFSSPDVAAILQQLYDKFRHNLIVVENNAYQGALIEWCQASGLSLPIDSINTQSFDNYIRLIAKTLEIEVKNAQWRFVASHFEPTCSCSFCKSLVELSEYPATSKTDFLASVCIALKTIQNYSKSEDIEVRSRSISGTTSNPKRRIFRRTEI